MGKIESYIGFAIKSGKIVFGIDNIKIYRKKMHLLLLCPDAGDNLKKEAEKCAAARDIQLIVTDRPLSGLVHKNNCKIAAITDRNLANAVILTTG